MLKLSAKFSRSLKTFFVTIFVAFLCFFFILGDIYNHSVVMGLCIITTGPSVLASFITMPSFCFNDYIASHSFLRYFNFLEGGRYPYYLLVVGFYDQILYFFSFAKYSVHLSLHVKLFLLGVGVNFKPLLEALSFVSLRHVLDKCITLGWIIVCLIGVRCTLLVKLNIICIFTISFDCWSPFVSCVSGTITVLQFDLRPHQVLFFVVVVVYIDR